MKHISTFSFWKNDFELNFIHVRDVEASIILYFKTLSLEQGRTGFEIWLCCLLVCHLRKHELIFPICVICEMGLIKVVMF